MHIVINLPGTNITEDIIRAAKWKDGSLFDIVLRGAMKDATILPKGHGRLIDADAVNLKDISPVDGFSVYGATAEDIDLTPTVLEAESEEP